MYLKYLKTTSNSGLRHILHNIQVTSKLNKF